VAGIDWVAANAGTIEVANMSLGGSGYNQAEYDAIQGAVNKGVAFAVAAGNSDADANNYSPAAFDNVLTVSALADFDGEPGGLGSPTCRADQDDTLADFSNWGSAVDIAAPGVCILSTYPIERGEYGTISGTSMASPHAAGALALLASRNNPNNATGRQ
jgi:subtilisin